MQAAAVCCSRFLTTPGLTNERGSILFLFCVDGVDVGVGVDGQLAADSTYVLPQ